MKRLHISLFLLWSVASELLGAGSVHGVLYDRSTKEPIVGAMLIIDGMKQGAVTGLDGRYEIRNAPSTAFTLTIRHMAYEILTKTVDSAGTTMERQLDFGLSPTAIHVAGIEITGIADRESDAAVRKTEQNALTTVNMVSANAILLSPDVTVANVVQRVSGLSIERSNTGDGQYAIVRGMDKRYNYTLIDGIKVPSPDSKNRYVPLDIFPADLLERLEVVKVLSPDMEGDAIGGVMNMIMKDAPSEFHFNLTSSIGGSQLNFDRSFISIDRSDQQKQSPEQRLGSSYVAQSKDFSPEIVNPRHENRLPDGMLGLSLGTRFFEDAVGMVMAGSYQNTDRSSHGVFFQTLVDQSNNLPTIQDIAARDYYTQQIRVGLHTKFDLRLNEFQRLDLSGTFARLLQNEVRTVTDTSVNINKRQGFGTGDISQSLRSKQEIQTIYAAAVHGDHVIPFGGRFTWTYAYSDANLNDPERTEIGLTTGITRDGTGTLIQTPILARSASRRWTSNDDLDRTVKADVAFVPTIGGVDVEWKLGLFHRVKTRSNYYDNYSLTPDPPRQVWTGTYSDITFSVDDPLGTPDDALNYSSHEYVTAFYSQVKVRMGDLIVLGGIRNESTDFGWVTKAPVTVVGKTGSIKYDDLLPSVNIKYMLSNTQNLRVSYYASISRPGFLEVVPYSITQEDYIEQGNPYLNRVQADNFDCRFELFPSPGEQLLIGGFYKTITNPIEYTLQIKPPNIIYLMPGNFGVATNYGAEIDITKYFSSFGVKANYTFTQSQITTLKILRYRDSQGNLTVRNEEQTRPMQGQSTHIGNCTFLYKNIVSGTDAQISAVYTGSRIASISPYKDNDLWQKATLQLDLSVQQQLCGGICLSMKINNLFNVPYEMEIRRMNPSAVTDIPLQAPDKNILVRRDEYGQSYTLGFRYTL